MIEGKELLITGGSGSLGHALVKEIMTNHAPRGIRIYSRGELRQAEMASFVKENGWKNIGFIIGDVQKRKELARACHGVDIILNLAAMKRVDTAEENPMECIDTNITGAENVIYAALDNNVKTVFHISTDKAVYPTTLYGATKKCAEDLIIGANVYKRGLGTPSFSCARYGNVLGSNGSVIRLFKRQREDGVLTITHPEMTRFWITMGQVARFILDRLQEAKGGEIFVPKMPSMKVMDIAKAMAPKADIAMIGIRGQEKLHETLITREESRYAVDKGTYWLINKSDRIRDLTFEYRSDNNRDWMTRQKLLELIEEL